MNLDFLFKKINLNYILLFIFLFSLSLGEIQKIYNFRLLTFLTSFLIITINYHYLAKSIKIIDLVFMALISFITLFNFIYFNNYIYGAHFFISMATIFLITKILVVKYSHEYLYECFFQTLLLASLLSLFTLKSHWAGGFYIESFADYPTFFAFNLSMIIPYLAYRKLFYKAIFIIVIIFLCNSRLSFFISIFILFYFLIFYKKYNLIFAFAFAFVLLSQTESFIFIYEKFKNFINCLFLTCSSLNLSDLGRYAYIDSLLQSNNSLTFFGNGIRSSRIFLANNFDAGLYNLPESLNNSGIHNIFIEIYFELGVIFLLLLLIFIVKYFFVSSYKKNIFGLFNLLILVTYFMFEGQYLFPSVLFFFFILCLYNFSCKKNIIANE